MVQLWPPKSYHELLCYCIVYIVDFKLEIIANLFGDDPVPYQCCMMGWEWRVFFPAEESSDVPDIRSLLQHRDIPRGSHERRSDVYIKCSES